MRAIGFIMNVIFKEIIHNINSYILFSLGLYELVKIFISDESYKLDKHFLVKNFSVGCNEALFIKLFKKLVFCVCNINSLNY